MPPETRPLAEAPDAIAPDGMEVRLLTRIAAGSMAHFRMPPRTVAEVWYFLAGAGEMWLSGDAGARTVAVHPGLSLSIPVGTAFQLRNDGDAPLDAVAVTAPPWPGDDEAVIVEGVWAPTV